MAEVAEPVSFRRGRAPAYAPADVEYVRQAAKTMNDKAIAERLKWPPLRVRNLRRANNIPSVPSFWTPERCHLLVRLYITEGRTMYETADALGITPEHVRQRARTMKLKRPREVRDRNLSSNNPSRRALPRLKPTPAPRPRILHKAPVQFARPQQPEKPWEPLLDRIERELARKLATAPTLAILLDEKELYVSQQLAAMQHAGKATPISGEGRFRTWGIAA